MDQLKIIEKCKAYGISVETYEALDLGFCPICHRRFGANLRRNIDHCHRTGEVRGIICSGCNSGLGFFRDSVENLRRAIDYLEGKYPVSVEKMPFVEPSRFPWKRKVPKAWGKDRWVNKRLAEIAAEQQRTEHL